MNTWTRLPAGVVLVAAGCLLLPLACEEPARKMSTAPQTQPATAPAPAGEARADKQPKPLPARALTGLEQLEPKIARPATPAGADKLPARAEADVKAAEKDLAQRKYAAAIDRLERAIGFAPGSARIHRLLGRAYMGLPNRGKATNHLAAAAKAAPDDLETHLLLGQLAAAQQQSESAIVHLRTALKCSSATPEEPAAAEALLTLALLLDRQGHWTAALEAYTLLAERIGAHGRDYAARAALREWVLRPERLLSRRGGLLLLLRKPDEAEKFLDRAYRRDRTNGRTAKLLIDAVMARQRYAEAEKLLLEMATQPSQRPTVPAMLSDLCRRTRDRTLPGRFWKALRTKHKTDAPLAIDLAKAAEQLGWTDEALAILHSVVTVKPGDPDLWRIICHSYGSRGKHKELFEMIERSLAGRGDAVEAVAAAMPLLAGAAKTPGVERLYAEWARKSTSDTQYALLYLAGRLATAKGKHILAADLYDRATERKKDFYRAYEALLEAYLAQKRMDRVDRLLDRVGRLAKDTHLPAYFRGKIALGRGETAAAIDALEQALTKNKGDMDVSLLLADAYTKARRTSDAIRTLDKALKAHPGDAGAARRLFDLYLAERKFRDARILAGRLLRADRESTAGRLMMIELALRAGQRKQAMVLLGQLAKQQPDNVDVQLLSARAMLGPSPGLVSKKEFDDAAGKLTRILRVQPGNRRARTALAELLAAVGKTAEAAGILGTLFDEDAGNLDLARKYVRELVRVKQYETALRALQRFRRLKPDDLWGRDRYLQLLGEAKRFDEAQKLAAEWITAADDENIQGLYRQELLRIFQIGKQYAQALKVADEWMAANPSPARRRRLEYTRVRLLGLLERYDKAGELADEMIAADPLSQAGRMLVSAAIEAKKYDRAQEVLEKRIGLHRKFLERLETLRKAAEGVSKSVAGANEKYAKALKAVPEALRTALSRTMEAKQYDQALKALGRWIKAIEATVEELRTLRIIVWGEAGQGDRARREAREWIRRAPRALAPRKTLVGLLAEGDHHAEADRLVTAWLKDFTPTTSATQPADAAETLRWLMETSIRLKISLRKHAEALALADRHRKIEPKNTDLLALKSAALTELNRDAEALKTMEAALAIKPEDPSLNNNLGYMYAERGIQLARAEEMLRKALAGRPGETAFADSLGWIFYKQGRLRDAGRAFQQLVDGRDDEQVEHGVILDHAGDAYYRLGWKDRAVAFWKRAIELARKASATREEAEVLSATPAKIESVRKGREPKVAPLGERGPKAPQKAGK